jgi:virginiamycin B lyase
MLSGAPKASIQAARPSHKSIHLMMWRALPCGLTGVKDLLGNAVGFKNRGSRILMGFLRGFFALSGTLLWSCVAYSASITGTVRGPDGTAFRAAFVGAENAQKNMTVYVLSDRRGHYHIENLPAGEYRVSIRAVGYDAAPQPGLHLTANQSVSSDFSLKKGVVQWSDISSYQGKQLFPPGHARDFMIQRCSICHFFQNRWVPLNLDEEGWKGRVEYMKALGVGGSINDQQTAELSSYLASLFGPHSVLPKSPADLPGYKDTLRSFGDDALNIVYVEYEMPAPHYFPFSAAPDSTGHLWIPNHGATNKISRLDPNTGKIEDFPVPYAGAALIHSTIPAADGSVWLAESGRSNSIGRWDPVTRKVTEYQDNPEGAKQNAGSPVGGYSGGGLKHTVRMDSSGNVWTSGVPLTKFDPKSGKFTHFFGTALTYDVKVAPNDDVWVTFPFDNKLGRVDGRTLEVSTWPIPTPNNFPRRLEIDRDGMIWVGEAGFPFSVGNMARFNPKTQTFKEYPLPGPDPSPYAMGFDTDGYLWYNSHYLDTVDRFDTRTGKVIEYPFPHAEISMREFFRDAQGRMWYGSNPNNRVGYFYLAHNK